MKPFSRGAYCTLLIISLASCYNLFAKETTLQKGLLWQIDKPGLTPSYLLGTIHSEDPRVTQLPPIVRSRLEQADSVSLELQMDMSNMMKLATEMFFIGEQSLDQLIDKELFAQIVKAMHQYYIPPMLVKRLKPWAVIATLSTPPTKTGQFLDLLLYKKAQKLQIPTYGLETIKEQLAVFEDFSLEEQVTMLKETLKQLDQMPETFDKLHELYLQRDLTALMTFSVKYMRGSSDNKALVDVFYKRIVDDRNIRMLDRMEKRLQEGNAFIAVGALHLPGDKGLLKLLQARGYRVSALY
ncbi:MAG: TraB/GumN family protein [Pseudomonadota bacterium]